MNDLYIKTSKGIIRRGSVDLIRSLSLKQTGGIMAIEIRSQVLRNQFFTLEGKEAEAFLQFFGGTDISQANVNEETVR